MEGSQVVKVRREKVAACMTCPLCNNFLIEATTISICLHSFCKKCIYEKFSDEDVDSCPVCDINLGCVPVDKLRPDNNLQDIRAKIFPFRRRKVEAPEIAETTPAVAPSTKRKEISLSSFVVSTSKVSSGKRTRAGVRKCSSTRGKSRALEETPDKEEYSMEDRMNGSSSHETLNKIIQNKKQSSSPKSSDDQSCSEHTEINIEQRDERVEFWKPLNTLVEAANRSKFSKPGSQVASHNKMDQTSSGEANVSMNKIKIEENGQIGDPKGEKSSPPSTKGLEKRKRRRQANKNKLCGEPSSSKLVLNVASRNWRDCPVWFSLVASGDQVGVDPLPQVSDAFLRIKDASVPVLSIHKYLMKKLGLASEEEVQVMCHGQPVMPHLKLSNLLDLWLRTSPSSKKVRTFVGDSGKDYMMVLSYSRKAAVPTS